MITICACPPCGWRNPRPFRGTRSPVITRSQKWSSITVAQQSSKMTLWTFSQPVVVDLHKVLAPAHMGNWTWRVSGTFIGRGSMGHLSSCMALYGYVPQHKPIPDSQQGTRLGIHFPLYNNNGSKIYVWHLYECSRTMTVCSPIAGFTAQHQKPQSERRRKELQLSRRLYFDVFWSPARVLTYLRRSQFSMSNSPSLHGCREGSIFRSEPEESSQRHVAGRQCLKNYCERMRTPDRCVDHCVLCVH